MLKYCARCGKFHDINYRHPDYNRHKGNAVDRFHQSSEWTAKSLEIRERDHFMCLVCLADDIISTDDTSVHHINKVADSWEQRLDDDNLITLCDMHHKMADRGEISKEILRDLVLKQYK